MQFSRKEITFLIPWAQEYSKLAPRGRAAELAQRNDASDDHLCRLLFAAFVAGVICKEDIQDGLYEGNPVWPWASYEQFGIRVRESEESIQIRKARLSCVDLGLCLN